jgi:protein O-mannosyl-transferase
MSARAVLGSPLFVVRGQDTPSKILGFGRHLPAHCFFDIFEAMAFASPIWSSKFWIPALMAMLGFLLYANTLHHGFVWDDKLVITSNPHTLRGWEGIPAIITSKVSVPNKNVWRPVPQVMFAVEYALFGANPLPGHLISAICYGLLCGLVYLFLRRLFPNVNVWLHIAVTLLFAVHPLHTEVVANIKSRDEILAMLLGICGVMATLKAVKKENWLWAFVGIALLGFALLSKPNAITLVPVLLLAHWYTYRRGIVSSVTLIPIFVGCAVLAMFFGSVFWAVAAMATLGIYGILAWRKALLPAIIVVILSAPLLLRPADQLQPTDGYDLISESSVLNNVLLDPGHPELVRPTAIANVARYLALAVYPYPLVHLYGYAQVPLVGYDAPLTWLALALIAAGTLIILFGIPRRSPIAFGLFFFAATLAVYSNLWVTIPDTMADRFMFMPLLGLCLAAIHSLAFLFRIDPYMSLPRHWKGSLAAVLVLIAAIGLARMTLRANADWESDATLIKNRIANMQNNAAAHAMLGFVLYQEAREAPVEARISIYQQALEALNDALVIYPDFFTAWQESGKIFAEVGNFEKAELCFLRAILLEPSSPDGYGFLGTLYFEWKAYEMAIPYFNNALTLSPNNEHLDELLGFCIVGAGQYDALEKVALHGQAQYPNNPNFIAMRAMHEAYHGHDAMAYHFAQIALRMSPHNMIAQRVLAALTPRAVK